MCSSGGKGTFFTVGYSSYESAKEVLFRGFYDSRDNRVIVQVRNRCSPNPQQALNPNRLTPDAQAIILNSISGKKAAGCAPLLYVLQGIENGSI